MLTLRCTSHRTSRERPRRMGNPLLRLRRRKYHSADRRNYGLPRDHVMCGAFSLHFPVSIIYDRFTVGGSGSFAPHYNARPAQVLPIILNTKSDELTAAFWGLSLKWALSKHSCHQGQSRRFGIGV